MTSQEIHLLTRLANITCQPKGVRCSYELDRKKRVFVWAFYRGKTRAGSTGNTKNVMALATKIITAK